MLRLTRAGSVHKSDFDSLTQFINSDIWQGRLIEAINEFMIYGGYSDKLPSEDSPDFAEAWNLMEQQAKEDFFANFPPNWNQHSEMVPQDNKTLWRTQYV